MGRGSAEIRGFARPRATLRSVPRPYPRTATRRFEAMIVDRLAMGLTYAAIAADLAELGVTVHVVRYTAERRGVRRPPGRPRAATPRLIPSRSPVTRW